MARPYRIQFDGAQYYVTACGTSGRKLFRNDEDFSRMLGMIEENASKHRVIIKGYCLLDNRIELIAETPKGNLSQFQQGYQTGYSSYYRKKYGAKGSMFADRFKSKLLGDGEFALLLSRYIHLLPTDTPAGRRLTDAQRVKQAAAYPWSSLGAFLAAKKADASFVDVKNVLHGLGGRVPERPKRYREFIASSCDKDCQEEMGRSPIAIGSEDFILEIKALHRRFLSGRKPKELKVYGRRVRGLSKTRVQEIVCEVLGKSKAEVMRRRKGSLDRALLSWALYEYANMSQDQIAEFLGLSAGATVSQHTRKIREAQQHDKAITKAVRDISTRCGE